MELVLGAHLQVDGSHLAGNEVEIEVATLINGGILYKIIPGEMVRTSEEKPQVRLHPIIMINKVSINVK